MPFLEKNGNKKGKKNRLELEMETILMQHTVLFHQSISRFQTDLACSASRSEERCCEWNCWRNVWPSDPELAISSGAAEMQPPTRANQNDRCKSKQSVQTWHDPPEDGRAAEPQLLPGNDKLSWNKQTDCKTLKTEEMPSILRGEWQKTSENKMKLIRKKKCQTPSKIS